MVFMRLGLKISVTEESCLINPSLVENKDRDFCKKSLLLQDCDRNVAPLNHENTVFLLKSSDRNNTRRIR